jgi:hypothetical protein
MIEIFLENDGYFDDLREIPLRRHRDMKGNISNVATYVQVISFLIEVAYLG